MERKLRRGILGVLILMSAIFVYIESEHLAHDSKHARGKDAARARQAHADATRRTAAMRVTAVPKQSEVIPVATRAGVPGTLPSSNQGSCSVALVIDPSAAVKRSRNVDLRGFQIDQSSFRCSVLSRGSATAQATVTMTFSITEQPARHEPDGMPLIAGFILLATSDTGVAFGRSMIAGRVALVRGGVDRRVYVATLELVHIGGVWTIELYYRHEDVHFWDRNESLKVGDVVRVKENKKEKDKWLTKIPTRYREILHPHYTAMYTTQPTIQLIVPGQPVTPDVALPWCDQVEKISRVGRVRGELVKLGFRPDPMWSAIKSNIRIRMLGDSNFGHIADDGYGAMPRSDAIIKGHWPLVGHKFPSGATALYRFFRGMDCVDHLTPILFQQVPKELQRGTHRRDLLVHGAVENDHTNRPCPEEPGDICLRFLYDIGEKQGPDITDESLHHVIVVNAGAWLITYKSSSFSRNFARGLRAVLQNCQQHHPKLRARTTLLWMETFAANESASEHDEGNGWRSLWNTRVLEHEDNVRAAVADLVDDIIPGNKITASIEHHIWDDPYQNNRVHQRRRTYNHVTDVVLNYVAWAGSRRGS